MLQTKTNRKYECSDQFLPQLDHFPCTETLKEFVCPKCGYWTLHEHVFNSHKCKLRKPFKTYFCRKCSNFISHSLLVMMKHIGDKCKFEKIPQLQSAKSSIKTNLKPPRLAPWFQCPHCDHKSKTKSHLKAHIRSRHTILKDSEYFKCEHCSYKTIYNFVLKRHVMARHKGVKQERKVKWYECKHCPYKAKYSRDLHRHIIFNHTASEDIKWFQCDKCFYRTKWKSDLQQHVKMQHASPEDIVWFQCEFCDYKEKRKGNLNRHMLHRHGQEKLFEFVDVCLA